MDVAAPLAAACPGWNPTPYDRAGLARHAGGAGASGQSRAFPHQAELWTMADGCGFLDVECVTAASAGPWRVVLLTPEPAIRPRRC